MRPARPQDVHIEALLLPQTLDQSWQYQIQCWHDAGQCGYALSAH